MNVARHPLVANHMCDAGTMADTLLRLFLISAALVDADTVAISHQTPTPQLLPISSAELIRALHGASSSITHACGRSGAAAFTAIAGDDVLSRCTISFEALSIIIDVQAFFAGDDNALEVELWGLWQTPSSRPQSAR